MFELYVVFAKEVKPESCDSKSNSSSNSSLASNSSSNNNRGKYIYKNKLITAEVGITEHVENDECKFAIWTSGRNSAGPSAPGIASAVQENRIVLKCQSLETKLLWVKKMREVIQESYFSSRLSTLNLTKKPTESRQKDMGFANSVKNSSTGRKTSYRSSG